MGRLPAASRNRDVCCVRGQVCSGWGRRTDLAGNILLDTTVSVPTLACQRFPLCPRGQRGRAMFDQGHEREIAGFVRIVRAVVRVLI